MFVDEDNACRSVMAEAIGKSLKRSEFEFSSAGLNPKGIEPRTLAFMKDKGIDLSKRSPHAIQDLETFHIVVTFSNEVRKALPATSRKTVFFEWQVEDPSRFGGAPEQVRAAYERSFEALRAHISDLVEAIAGDVTV
jgi:arsenate reductase